MKKALLTMMSAATFLTLLPLTASAATLPHREQIVEKVADQQSILGGKFVSVTYEDDYLDATGKQTSTSKRQAILPAVGGKSVDTTGVLVQTISGKLTTILVPSSTLEESLKSLSQSANIVRILEVSESPIESTPYSTYAGFHFSLGGNEFDTPWYADDAKVIGQVNDAKLKSAFGDVASDRWSAGAIYLLASDGIVSGVGYGQFSPSASVSRAAFLQMLAGTAKMAGFDLTNEEDLPTDISSASWAKEAASKVKAYLDSQEKGSFDAILGSQLKLKPNEPITRAEAAQIMAFFVNESGSGDLNFSDWTGGVEKTRVASLVDAGGITGVGSGKFDPNRNLTREQMASMVVRLLYIN